MPLPTHKRECLTIVLQARDAARLSHKCGPTHETEILTIRRSQLAAVRAQEKMMHRLLVVVDGTAQATVALEHALAVAAAVPGSEIVLLSIEPGPSPWQAHRPSGSPRQDIARQLLNRAGLRAQALGIRSRSRMETGEKADVVTKVAEQEGCDHIFVPEARRSAASRALMALAAACTGTSAGRIITESDVPVTVVGSKGPR